MTRKELVRRIIAAEEQLAGLKLALAGRRAQTPVIEVVDRTGEGEMSDLRRPVAS